MILLVAVPLLLLLILSVGVCGLVLWLRSRSQHHRLGYSKDHDVTMLKVPSGADPTYGVRMELNVIVLIHKRTFRCHRITTKITAPLTIILVLIVYNEIAT